MSATLYGVGVGPGAPDLITLRALETIRRAPVLALPRGSDYGASKAFEIVQPTIGEIAGQKRLFLTFPMSMDPERLKPAWERAFARIGAELDAGRDVAFLTEGDPSLYSTFIYLQNEARRRWPNVRIEVVPGVSSITAVPAVTGVPLADGQERIAILPGAYGLKDLAGILRRFDTVILMKIGPELPRIIAALEAEGLLDRAVYVSRATMREQRIVHDLRTIGAERGDCFAMVVVSRKERNGFLAGAVPLRDLAS
ncbi:MAG: precorrin-2 C(20)-methyltransferase [Methylococcales bacterium]